MTRRTAVVLFNLGGPDSPAAVKPFLRNLFSDPAILRQPALPRWLLARLIAALRAPKARRIYGRIGGGSPILAQTRAQAGALSEAIRDLDARVFVCMRYWHPMASETAQEVGDFAPDRIVLLPLYPQFSTSTTASSFAAWDRAAAAAGLVAETRRVCCYPAEPGFVEALARLTRREIERASRFGRCRVLFSVHGLPKKFVAAGDPYQAQVERTVAAVAARLDGLRFDPVVCYQSRVGPLAWLGPSTEDEIERAGADGAPVVVRPGAFVSEHSETLVELDMDYARRAEAAGVPAYLRTPAVGTDAAFVGGLAGLVRRALDGPPGIDGGDGERCARGLRACPLAPPIEAPP